MNYISNERFFGRELTNILGGKPRKSTLDSKRPIPKRVASIYELNKEAHTKLDKLEKLDGRKLENRDGKITKELREFARGIRDHSNDRSDTPVIDVDLPYLPQMVSSYLPEIVRNLLAEEEAAVALDEISSELTEQRSEAVGWVCSVHAKFNLMPQTLYMSVWLIDRYLPIPGTPAQTDLRILAAAAIFAASKYEETYQAPPLRYIAKEICGSDATMARLHQIKTQILASETALI